MRTDITLAARGRVLIIDAKVLRGRKQRNFDKKADAFRGTCTNFRVHVKNKQSHSGEWGRTSRCPGMYIRRDEGTYSPTSAIA